MYNCLRCNKVFRNNYDLIRHQARKFPCIITNQQIIPHNQQKTIEIPQNQQIVPQNQQIIPQNQQIKLFTCEYCFKSFRFYPIISRSVDFVIK